MIVKFMGSASRMHARTSSCRTGRGVRPDDRTAELRSGVVSLDRSDLRIWCTGIAGIAGEVEDIMWAGNKSF